MPDQVRHDGYQGPSLRAKRGNPWPLDCRASLAMTVRGLAVHGKLPAAWKRPDRRNWRQMWMNGLPAISLFIQEKMF